VILNKDVLTLLSLATVKILVLFLIVAHLKVADLNQRTVTTRIHAPKIAVHWENVFMKKLLVMIKMLVPMIAVMLLLDADLFLNKLETQICAPLELVMQLEELLIPQETVKMETNVQSTTVMLKKDANTLLKLFLKIVQLNLQDVMEMHCV